MTEDTKDKIRRNVVTFSAFIIGGAFLGLNVAQDFKIFGLGIGMASPFRFWLAITVVLIYLALRYHFDVPTATERVNALIVYKAFRAK
jgi:hypothetical protein